MLTKKSLENLEELAQMKINPEKTEKLLRDLEKILEHFEELKEIKTDDVLPVASGVFAENVFRDDETGSNCLKNELTGEQFPEKEKGFLKIPPVFG